MKKIFCLLLSVLFVQGLFAQMDDRFYHPDKEWIAIDLLNFQEIVFYADSDTLYSVLFQPEGTPKATVLYFHGNGGNISKWTNHIRPLVDDGFQVCVLDYRGYGKSTGKPTHLTIARDAQMLLDTLLTREDVKHTKLIVYGASIGSQVAASLTKENNRKISALVFDGMMTSFTDVALLTSPAEYHDTIRQFVTSPYSAKEDIKEIKGVNLLFIHSKEDLIPIEGAQRMYDNSPCANKMFWIYEGKHIEAPVKYPKTFIEYMNKLL
jgi:predicted alpha/beta-fold hydrolase